MKKLFIIIMFVLAWISIGLTFIPKSVHAQPRPRFEHLLTENGEDNGMFKVYHDRETGQELACYERGVYSGYAPSCWLTGRNWK